VEKLGLIDNISLHRCIKSYFPGLGQAEDCNTE